MSILNTFICLCTKTTHSIVIQLLFYLMICLCLSVTLCVIQKKPFWIFEKFEFLKTFEFLKILNFLKILWFDHIIDNALDPKFSLYFSPFLRQVEINGVFLIFPKTLFFKFPKFWLEIFKKLCCGHWIALVLLHVKCPFFNHSFLCLFLLLNTIFNICKRILSYSYKLRKQQ